MAVVVKSNTILIVKMQGLPLLSKSVQYTVTHPVTATLCIVGILDTLPIIIAVHAPQCNPCNKDYICSSIAMVYI